MMSASGASGRSAPSRPSPSAPPANARGGRPPYPAAARRPARRRFFGPVFACLALCAAALPAQAQDVTLVTNWDESAFIEGESIMAQAFTTGSQTGGYTLKSVELDMREASTSGTLRDYLTIRENDNNTPGDVVVTFTPPSSLSSSLSAATFTAPANTVLDANTLYWVVAGDHWRFSQSTNRPYINRVAGTGQSGETGWSIANTRFWKNALDASWNISTSSVLKIRILGPSTNNAPVFAVSSLDRSVAENTAAGSNVGDPIPEATDADSGDTLTYSMEGTDAASFDFDADNRQIKTRTGVTYDYEAKSSYSVTIKVEDGNGGSDTVDVTISLTDADEPPAAPAAPTVTATSGSTTSLDVSWTAPANTGKPAIASYDLRYRQGTSGSWTDGPQDQTGTSASITGLTANTAYQVQVRATNDEGDGDWSPSGSGSTTGVTPPPPPTNNAPVFADATLTRSIAENTAANTAVGAAIPAATDADSDTLTYSMEGTDAASFDFDAANRQIETRTGVTYDFEATSSYSVTIKVEDGRGGTDTVDVTISVTDENEPPAAPGAPTVTTTSGSNTRLTVSWTAPDNAGRPAITGYDLRHSTDGSNWTESSLPGVTLTSVTAAITGLTPGTEYQVQVRAVNDEGDGGWSPSGTGSTAANNAPVFADATLDRSVGENSAAGRFVGDPIPEATDADSGDTLTYSMEGADAASFDFDADDRQIETKAGVTYDFEAKSSYSVTIKVEDAAGDSDTVDVTISVTDQDEPPAAPAAPTVAATSGSTTSLDVSWTAPDNAGKPAITGYNLRYRQGTSGSWTAGPQGVSGTSAAITGLAAGTAYQVQVQAVNDEGNGDWSPSGSGSTTASANNAPEFPNATEIRYIAENSSADINVGDPIPEATDADSGDTLTYSMEGTDAASFDFDASTRQIRTRTGVTYNFEAKSSYGVTIKVEDGNGGSDTVAVTIGLTDVDEPPDAPAAPTVTATSGSTTSLDVSWTAPDNAGPGITSYDLRYSADGGSSWTDGPQDVSGTSASITGLTADTSYQVQVRATNDEGDSDWSASGTGSTAATLPPVVTVSAASTTVDEGEGIIGTTEGLTFTRSYATDAALPLRIQVDQSRHQLQDIGGGAAQFVLDGDITINADETSRVITRLRTRENDLDEADATVTFTVLADDQTPARYTVGDPASVTFTITDDDDPPEVSVAPTTLSVAEDAGTASVEVKLSAESGKQVTVDYDTADDTATAGDDYTAASDTLTFAAGETSKTVSVPITDDTANEADESFTLTLSNAVNATLGSDDTATVTITDDDAANNAPVFADATLARSIAENTAANTAVGAAIPAATDADSGDTLTYNLEGTDAASFGFDAANRQIETRTGVTYDFEAKSSYSVTVKVEDGNGGSDTVDVTISLTDVDEPPSAPGAPTVTATSGSTTSLDVSWTAPDNAGRPAITGYDLRYRQGTSGSWTDGPEDVTGTSASITGLTADTSYQVQVRAANDEGDGDWSASGTGSTAATADNAFVVTITAANSTADHASKTGRTEYIADFTVSVNRAPQERLDVWLGWEEAERGLADVSANWASRDRYTSIHFTPDRTSVPLSHLLFDRYAGDNKPLQTLTYFVAEDRDADDPHNTAQAVPDYSVGTPSKACVTVNVDTPDSNKPDCAAMLGPRPQTQTGAPRVPGAPGGLTATASGDSRIDLAWTAPAGEVTGYEVEWSADGETGWEAVDPAHEGTEPAYADEGLEAGTRRFYRVRAVNGADAGAWSGLAGATTRSERRPRSTTPDRPLTAAFDAVPDEHDGESTFTFTLSFSEDVEGLSYKTLRDSAFEVDGGSVKRARRQESGRNQNWTIHVAPDGDGDVSIALPATADCAADGAICTADGRPLSNALSGTVRGPALLSVADARADEGAGATLEFAVTLSRAAGAAVAVDYATRDGSATAGEDYTAASGTLEFAAGERSKTVSVTVLDDAVDEGEETLVLALSNATGARLDDAEATGTIANADPLPKAWLARFARASADLALDAIDARLREDPVAAGLRASFGGRSGSWGGLPGAGPADEDADGFGAEPGPGSLGGHPGWGYGAAAPGIGGRGYGRAAYGAMGPEPGAGMHGGYHLSLGDLLLGSSFRAAFGSDEDGGRWLTAWGRGAGMSYRGAADGVALDGEVRTYTAGADAEWRRWLAGVAVSYSTGRGGFRDHGGRGAGSLDSTMTTVLPYLRWKAGDRLSAWGAAGFGAGGLTLLQDGADEGWDTGVSMRTVAAGARGVFARLDGGLELSGRVDMRLTSVESDAAQGLAGNLAATQAEVSRVRFMFEGTKRFELGIGRVLTPTLEVGVRRDGGDAETGAGLEVGGALRYADAALGLTVDLNARTLAAHGDGAYREWGAGASVTLDPGAAGLGLSLTLVPEWGAASGAGGAERLWSMRDAREMALGGGADRGARLRADVGYGLPAFRGRGAMVPFAGLESSAYGRDLRTGVRWTLGELSMSLEATRRESALSPAEHGAAFTASTRW